MQHGAESTKMRVWKTTPLWRLRVRMAHTLKVHDADDVLMMFKGREVEDYEATVGSSGMEHGEILQADKRTFHAHVAVACDSVSGDSSPLAAKTAWRCCLNFRACAQDLNS